MDQLKKRPDQCERCGQSGVNVRFGVFNNQYLCDGCIKHERQHPDYAQADARLRQALARGQYPIVKMHDSAKTWADLGMEQPSK